MGIFSFDFTKLTVSSIILCDEIAPILIPETSKFFSKLLKLLLKNFSFTLTTLYNFFAS